MVIAILCGLLVWQDKQNRRERLSLTNALIAKNATEFKNLEMVEKVTTNAPGDNPDLIPFDQLSDEEFMKAAEQEANG